LCWLGRILAKKQRERTGSLDDSVGVQLAEQPFDYPVLDPAVEALVNHVPIAVFLRQPPPLAPVFAYVQQRSYEGYVLHRYPAALDGQYVPDFPACSLVYFHA